MAKTVRKGEQDTATPGMAGNKGMRLVDYMYCGQPTCYF